MSTLLFLKRHKRLPLTKEEKERRKRREKILSILRSFRNRLQNHSFEKTLRNFIGRYRLMDDPPFHEIKRYLLASCHREVGRKFKQVMVLKLPSDIKKLNGQILDLMRFLPSKDHGNLPRYQEALAKILEEKNS